MTSPHSPLLARFLPELRSACSTGPALDLACGRGRNGLYLARQGLPTVFADRNPEALAAVGEQLHQDNTSAELWRLDLESGSRDPLQSRRFGAILVFRYLYRPLFPAMHDAVHPGGLVVYETFTAAQAQLGRPKNPDFLLQPGELQQRFHGWDILHSYEGQAENNAGQTIAIAQLVARKP